MLTLAVFTGATDVPATAHVIVCVVAAVQVVAAFCEVTENGPDAAFTVTNFKSEAVCPPPT